MRANGGMVAYATRSEKEAIVLPKLLTDKD